jgi:hypothetical protein
MRIERLILAALLTTACSPSALRIVGGSNPGPVTRPPRAPLPADAPGKANRPRNVSVCRSTSRPPGYIAIDYFTLSSCAGSDSRRYNGVSYTDYTYADIGARLVVCADEAIPNGWERTSRNTSDFHVCPREPTDQSLGPTAIEMARVR